MVEMLGGGEVPSGYYFLLKLASQLSSLYTRLQVCAVVSLVPVVQWLDNTI